MTSRDAETAVFPLHEYGIAQPTGRVQAPDIVALSLALTSHADWRPGFTEVWDVRFAESVDLVPKDVPTMLDVERRTREALDGSTTVIVATRPLILFSVKFYARLVKPLGRTVVAADSSQAAAALLGVDALPDLRAR
ncbi:hypothetical protein [Rubrivirga litoralis]|uniref:Uncharacterized protein n=1 Tax=Rubrivirga litoralis TaxID=3075598 RepID=A0ABU3BTJ0_9BACT|nr:hypothetical protein [Rubrivirga sp. F394]MDT0632599.1 hypothetical protein [Rubrivirga sp. F394]